MSENKEYNGSHYIVDNKLNKIEDTYKKIFAESKFLNYLYQSLEKWNYVGHVALLLGSTTCLFNAWAHEFKQSLVSVVIWLFLAELSYPGFRQHNLYI